MKYSADQWKSTKNRQEFFKSIANLPSFDEASLNRLYSLTYRYVRQQGGTIVSYRSLCGTKTSSLCLGQKILALFNSSVAIAVTNSFPDHEWKIWNFVASPRGWWTQLGHEFALGEAWAVKQVRLYLSDLTKANGIAPSDWATLASSQLTPTETWRLRQLGGLKVVIRRLFAVEPAGVATLPRPNQPSPQNTPAQPLVKQTRVLRGLRDSTRTIL